jgi:hypothetical protein
MIHEDQVFIADVVVIDQMWETMTMNVINRLIGVTTKLSAIVKDLQVKRAS